MIRCIYIYMYAPVHNTQILTYISIHARSVVGDLDFRTVIGGSIHRITGVLQVHNMGHSDHTVTQKTQKTDKCWQRISEKKGNCFELV